MRAISAICESQSVVISFIEAVRTSGMTSTSEESS